MLNSTQIIIIIVAIVITVIIVGLAFFAYLLRSMAQVINVLEDQDTPDKIINKNTKQNDRNTKPNK